MPTIIHKGVLLALSLVSASACASYWSYDGKGSPEHWGNLDDAWKTCLSGKNQSPINIDFTLNAHLTPLETHYTDGPTTLINNGHTIQAGEAKSTRDTIVLDGKTWTLQQFHFHAPSENTIHGKTYAMEMHLVHSNAEGELVVVAVMFDQGAKNEALEELWRKMPAQAGQSATLATALDLNRLLPDNKTYWRFSGSLTTPPCSEGVTWIVLKHPLTLSADQLEKFSHTLHHANNRPVQSLHGRVVVE